MVKLDINEVNQMLSAGNQLSSQNAELETVVTSLRSFADESSLTGKAWTSAKTADSDAYLPLVQGMIDYNDALIAGNKQVQAAVDAFSYGTPLDEQDLVNALNGYEQSRNDYEYMIREIGYNELANPIMTPHYEQLRKECQWQIESLNAAIEELNNQIQALHDFADSVRGAYDEANSLKANLEKGFKALGQGGSNVYQNGEFKITEMADWAKNLCKINSEEVETQDLTQAVSNLGLSDDALAYWKKEMESELKNIPQDQWEKKIKEAVQNLQFDDDGNILQIKSFMQGVIVLKNGMSDAALTDQANKELDSEHWAAVRDNFGQLLFGGISMIGGGLLDLGGVTLITGGSGLTLTGAGAVVGVPALAGGVTMEAVGTAAVIGGATAYGSAQSKINSQTSEVQYSFTTSSADRATAVEDTNKKIDELTKDEKDITKPGSRYPNYEKPGGVDQLNKDFDDLGLSDVKDTKTTYGPGKTGKLPDGSSVSIRSSAKSGDNPTLEISRTDGTKIKIRYPEVNQK